MTTEDSAAALSAEGVAPAGAQAHGAGAGASATPEDTRYVPDFTGKSCFIIMPYGRRGQIGPDDTTVERKHFDDVHDFIREILVKLKIDPSRSDRTPEAVPIHAKMLVNIIDADLAIVDITTRNPNVFYELGVRHTARRNATLLIGYGDTLPPFNLTGVRVISYDLSSPALRKDSERKLMDAIIANLSSRVTDSLVHSLLPGLNLTRPEQPLTHDRQAIEVTFSPPAQAPKSAMPAAPEFTLGVIKGDLVDVDIVDVLVNPESTRMEMARVHDSSVSAFIRYHGAKKDSLGNVLRDSVYEELKKQVGRSICEAGRVIVTSPGDLRNSNVRAIFHIAAQHGEPCNSKIETLYSSQQFSNDLLSCRVAGDESASIIREGQCLWVRGRARLLDLDKTGNNLGATDTTGSFSAGGQLTVAPDWRLGFAAGYDTIGLSSAYASSSGDRANIGGILKYNPGPLLLAAGATAGWGHFDTDRSIAFGGFAAAPHSTQDVDYVSGQLHAAYLMQQTGWYAKPMVDAAITEIDLHGFTETNGGGAALHVNGKSDTVVSISPGIEVGTEMRFDDVSVLRPFVRIGLTWQDSDNFALAAGFDGAPAAVSPFVINTKFADVLADINVGIDVINASGAVLRLQYDGRFAEDTTQNSVSIKGSVPF